MARTLTTFVLALLIALAATPAPAQMADCTSEAQRIKRAQDELPKLEVAPPGDRTIVCIALETNLLFAKRLSSHLAQCPRSSLARTGPAWTKIGRDYQAQYESRGCKQTIKGLSGLTHDPEARDPSAPYSITSSARASKVGGIARPSNLAVLRLMTSSNRVGCSTGRSAGFAPFRMRST